MSIWQALGQFLVRIFGAKPAPQQPATPTPTVSVTPAPTGPRPTQNANTPVGQRKWRGNPGKESASWRNRNPSNLRPPATWTPDGWVCNYDTGVSGVFAVFETEKHGWQAMARRILQLHAQGKDTVRKIIGIWAPPSENNTEAYIAGVAAKIGVTPDMKIDPRQLSVMLPLAHAIRQHEGLPRDPAWDETEMRAGLIAGGAKP